MLYVRLVSGLALGAEAALPEALARAGADNLRATAALLSALLLCAPASSPGHGDGARGQ